MEDIFFVGENYCVTLGLIRKLILVVSSSSNMQYNEVFSPGEKNSSHNAPPTETFDIRSKCLS